MNALFLIPLAIGMGAIGLVAFIWALQHNQFDDLERARWRVLDRSGEPEDQVGPGTGDRERARKRAMV
ncbi:MAG: cbb3-type cytochrome oxidase assembly protein CcoS [Bauldia sp.]|uniref:cbb3-type cytochrome oxidase assembly protein CcoS n=1 Tax=Bauldia sp. TaxID=2575872 RepID=UPI001D46E5D7|nr:cbb3-type cytochrome oxidase assembly protein CcoS [Bauldia sp.]MCB1494314.1 cbb3-type cytochrome oxidase assembly protein CcoS [Bauldia sp.]